MLTKDNILDALKAVKYPGYSRDIVSFGFVRQVDVADGAAHVDLRISSSDRAIALQIEADSAAAIRKLPGIKSVAVHVQPADVQNNTKSAANPDPWAGQARIPGVKHVIAVASGKGGVGKSTVSVNLACALKHLGVRVGLMDCDIYGPSLPLMMGVREKPTISGDEKLVPPSNHGIKLMSIGLLVDGDAPVIWRGPMINKTIQQFLFVVDWGELDYLVVDLPPGTGDAQLSLCQMVPLDGGVVVTTPQEASLGVVRKGLGMFEKVNVPILGLVENMSYFTAPNGDRVEIFGHGGGKAEAARRHIEFLGEIPIYTEIRAGGDKGLPVTVGDPGGPPARAFLAIAKRVREKMG